MVGAPIVPPSSAPSPTPTAARRRSTRSWPRGAAGRSRGARRSSTRRRRCSSGRSCCSRRCTTSCSPTPAPSWPAGTRASIPSRRSGRRAAGDDPYPAFRRFCLEHRAEIEQLVGTRTTQTNEVGRCLGAAARAAARPPRHRPAARAAGGGVQRRAQPAARPVPARLRRPRAWVGDDGRRRPAARPGVRRPPGAGRRRGAAHRRPGRPRPGADRRARRRRGALAGGVRLPGPGGPHRAAAPGGGGRPAAPGADRGRRRRRPTSPRSPRTLARGGGARACSTAGRSRTSPTADAFAARSVAGLRPGGVVDSRSSRPARCRGSTCRPATSALTPEMAANTVVALMHVTPDGRTDRVLARSHPHLDWIQWLGRQPQGHTWRFPPGMTFRRSGHEVEEGEALAAAVDHEVGAADEGGQRARPGRRRRCRRRPARPPGRAGRWPSTAAAPSGPP